MSKNRSFVDSIILVNKNEFVEVSLNENEYLIENRKVNLIAEQDQKLIDQDIIQYKEYGSYLRNKNEIKGYIKINYRRYIENMQKRIFYVNNISIISLVESMGKLKVFQQSENCNLGNIFDESINTSYKNNYYMAFSGLLNCSPYPDGKFVGQVFPMQVFDKKFAILVAAPEKTVLAAISKVILSINLLLFFLIIISFYFYIRLRQVEIKSHEERRRYDAQLAQSSRLSLLGEMASGVAHEINNPLSVIINSIMILKKNVENHTLTDQMLMKYIEKIENTTFRITKIINGLRSFSRDGANDQFVEVSLTKIISETLDLATEKIKKNDIDLRYQAPQGAYMINGSEVQLGQVILNLVSNAIDAIETEPEKWIQIEVVDGLDKFFVKIINSGPRISKDLVNKIMQPFFTTKPVGKGTGLGLSISYGIMQKHKGTLSVDLNHTNTCFVLEFSKSI